MRAYRMDNFDQSEIRNVQRRIRHNGLFLTLARIFMRAYHTGNFDDSVIKNVQRRRNTIIHKDIPNYMVGTVGLGPGCVCAYWAGLKL